MSSIGLFNMSDEEFDKKYCSDFLKTLLFSGNIPEESPAYGITKLIINKDRNALCLNQQQVFEKYIMIPYQFLECNVCGKTDFGLDKSSII